jgi:hypothetical protein
MKRTITMALAGMVASLALAPLAHASLITVQSLPGGTSPATLGGYTMSGFAAETRTGSTVTQSSAALGTGDVIDFAGQNMVSPLGLNVQDPAWWAYNQGNVYTVNIATSNYITLLLPENTRAVSFWVGASVPDGIGNNAWLQAYSGSDSTGKVYFRTDRNSTPGFGVYSSDGCSAISKIVIEPYYWGVGNFSINQGTCSEVPEPAPLGLLGAALLGFVLVRGMRRRATVQS